MQDKFMKYTIMKFNSTSYQFFMINGIIKKKDFIGFPQFYTKLCVRERM